MPRETCRLAWQTGEPCPDSYAALKDHKDVVIIAGALLHLTGGASIGHQLLTKSLAEAASKQPVRAVLQQLQQLMLSSRNSPAWRVPKQEAVLQKGRCLWFSCDMQCQYGATGKLWQSSCKAEAIHATVLNDLIAQWYLTAQCISIML